ncbi:hypothetical protein ZWY2020_018531 [Hordeum vulgare]|nr:hypothetical protein ZWY2020_018531 [Hordeum vulgare]
MMADVVGMPHSAYHELRIKTMAADEQSLLVEEVAASVGKGSLGRAGGVQDRVEIQRPEVWLRRGRRYRTRRISRKIIASRLAVEYIQFLQENEQKCGWVRCPYESGPSTIDREKPRRQMIHKGIAAMNVV